MRLKHYRKKSLGPSNDPRALLFCMTNAEAIRKREGLWSREYRKHCIRPQSRLVLLAAGAWARGPVGSEDTGFETIKFKMEVKIPVPAAKRATRLWGREWKHC